jgi:hypothetical protein
MCQCVNVGAKAKEPLADAGWYRLLGTKCLGKTLGGSDDRFLVYGHITENQCAAMRWSA